jgi:hypothetical protein
MPIVLENDPAQHNGEWGCRNKVKTIVRRNVTMFPIVYHVMSHKIASISGDFVIERHIMFVITILQKISTNKGHNRNSQFIARKFSTKNHGEPPIMLSFLRNKTTRGTCEYVCMMVTL